MVPRELPELPGNVPRKLPRNLPGNHPGETPEAPWVRETPGILPGRGVSRRTGGLGSDFRQASLLCLDV